MSRGRNADHDDVIEEPSRKQRAWTVIAGGTLGLIVVLAVVLAFQGPKGPAVEPEAPALAAGTTPAGKECPASPPQMGPVSGAPESKWELVGTIAAPRDNRHGPHRTNTDGYRVCFAHTPFGALYAAVNFFAVTTSDQRGEPAYRLYLARTPERDLFLEQGDLMTRMDRHARVQVRGFRFERVAENDVVVGVALGVEGSTSYVRTLVPLRWENDDWKVVIPPDGRMSDGTSDSLTGFTKWGGA